MARKLNAELWDKMHYMFRDFNDRMVHVELHYDFRIDIHALKTVLICFLEKAPVLHSSFAGSPINPYWSVKDYKIEDVLTISEPKNLQEEIDHFLTQYIPPESDLQIKVALFYHKNKSVLCIVENHMCMDGGDLKYFLNALSLNYTEYVKNKKSPLAIKTGTRSYDRVYSDLSPTDQKAAQKLYKNVSSRDKHGFPLTPDSKNDRSFIVRRDFDSERFRKLRAAGKKAGATVNDLLIAIYMHSLYEIANFGEDESLSVSCAVDLRRHIKDTSKDGLTNHTAFMQCLTPKKGRNINETLAYVMRSTEKNKQDRFLGLYSLPLLKLAYSILPYAASEEIIKIGYSNPLIGMSNIGVLDAEKLALDGNKPTYGFLTGAVKYKPYVLLSAISLNNMLTLSMCVKGNEEDKKIVNRFFDLLEKNFDELSK
jgi:NRPS condensation-like uncharacterized protein